MDTTFRKVDKTWGHEEIVVNDGFCFKRLIIRAGHRVGLHHHQVKDELFYLESGRLHIELAGVECVLQPQEWLRVRPGTWHTMAALADSVLLEASTHDDPTDSYRDLSRPSGKITP